MEYLFGLIVAAFVIKFILKAIQQTASAMTPPARVALVTTQPSKRHSDNVEKHKKELEARGFRKLGTYRVDPMKGVLLTAFAHPEQSLCGIVYTHPVAGCFMDVVALTEDDRSLTVSTAPAGGELDQREGHQKIYDRTMTVTTLYETALQKRPEGQYVSWNAGNFARKFEEAYAKEMAWRVSRGGATREEVRRIADATGRTFTDEQIEMARQTYQEKLQSAHRDSR